MSAADALRAIATGYSNLEFNLLDGKRGKRAGYLETALAVLLETEAATAVNNCAAALVLTLRSLISPEKNEVIVSRGELVEIGGGFRIPEVLETSGARLVEVGATNKTHLKDYAGAITERTALILKVHRSNFFMDGFVAAPERRELAALARKKHVPFVEDLGSGVLTDTENWAADHHETTPREVIKSGAALVCFSGDKLLGGPQAGIIAGKSKHIAALKKHPFFRALRCDKLILSALQHAAEIYLRGDGETLPLNQSLRADSKQLKRRATKLAKALAELPITVAVAEGESQVGGGALPQATLPSITLDLVPENFSLTGMPSCFSGGTGFPSRLVIGSMCTVPLTSMCQSASTGSARTPAVVATMRQVPWSAHFVCLRELSPWFLVALKSKETWLRGLSLYV